MLLLGGRRGEAGRIHEASSSERRYELASLPAVFAASKEGKCADAPWQAAMKVSVFVLLYQENK